MQPSPSSRTRRTAPGVLLAAAALLMASCGTGDSTPSSGASTSTGGGAPVKTDKTLSSLLPDKFKGGEVKVATDVPYAPFELFANPGSDQITGIDYDLGQAIAGKLGVKFTFEEQKFDGIIPAIKAGKYDVVMSSMTDNKDREKVLTFVDYSVSGTGVLVKKGNPDHITTIEDLCGKAVGIESGTIQVNFIKNRQSLCQKAGKPPIEVQTYPKNSDAQLAVKSGKAVAVIADKPVSAYEAKTIGGGKVFEVVDDPKALGGYESSPNGIGMLRSNAQLAKAIQKALQSLMDDGTYDKILAKYGAQSIKVDKATIDGAVN